MVNFQSLDKMTKQKRILAYRLEYRYQGNKQNQSHLYRDAHGPDIDQDLALLLLNILVSLLHRDALLELG